MTDRLKEGRVFRKLNVKSSAFTEYAPLETVWTPITGENFIYIYCLWVTGALKGNDYGRELMEYCLNDIPPKNGKSSVCMLDAKKQRAWLSDQSSAKKPSFEAIDVPENGYELLALFLTERRRALPLMPKKEKSQIKS